VFVPYAGSQFANLSAAEITAYAEKNTDGMTYYGTLGPVRPFRDWPFFSTAFLETRCLPRQVRDEHEHERISVAKLKNHCCVQAETYLWRSPHVALSSLTDFIDKGAVGDQQHAWQATLNGSAVVFTTHP
jgi:hypothetical protein